MKGIRIMATFAGCDSPLLTDAQAMLKEVQQRIAAAGLTVVGKASYTFDTGGVTCVVLLAESHVSIHTWPEKRRSLTLDIYTCNYTTNNDKKAQQLFGSLEKLFLPSTVQRRTVRM